MLLIFRVIVVVFLIILICIVGCIYCLFRPFHPNSAKIFGRWFGRLSMLFGLKVEQRIAPEIHNIGPCIYIANHQNNYDMVTVTNIVQEKTVTVGKKSLLWVPFFGPLYWLTGNILIDRDNRSKAHSTMNQIVGFIQQKKMSVWLFPEGTRSRGRGLLPFKAGAFHVAIAAGVPIVPICVSNTHQQVKLNRWCNGDVIVEILPPIDTTLYNREQVRELNEYCRQVMLKKLTELDVEVARRNAFLK